MIEEELRALMARMDPVPAALDEAARVAFTWRTIDAELAELMLDSAEAEALAVRGAAAPRTLSFEAPALVIELEVTGEGRTRSVAGQLLPPGPATVTLEQPEERFTVEADELGRFAFEAVHAGPTRVRVNIAAGEVAIPWTTI